ncbi:hypothetical protein ADL34_32350 [Streptomyces sp. NRRL WC-3605]|nr:hypothetical protein ADL33_32765 [Streptomyces sp. NRRL WC-3604]KUL68776.1 hypothetical protein ADL34_32350 [Streptomyces sp. NRRL WC-3605]
MYCSAGSAAGFRTALAAITQMGLASEWSPARYAFISSLRGSNADLTAWSSSEFYDAESPGGGEAKALFIPCHPTVQQALNI